MKWPAKPKRRALWLQLKGGRKPNGFGASKFKPATRLRSRSKAYEIRMHIYRNQREEFLRRHSQCAVYPEEAAEHIHHRKGRGRFLFDETTWLAVGARAHREIHDNPAWAYEKGYMLKRNETARASI